MTWSLTPACVCAVCCVCCIPCAPLPCDPSSCRPQRSVPAKLWWFTWEPDVVPKASTATAPPRRHLQRLATTVSAALQPVQAVHVWAHAHLDDGGCNQGDLKPASRRLLCHVFTFVANAASQFAAPTTPTPAPATAAAPGTATASASLPPRGLRCVQACTLSAADVAHSFRLRRLLVAAVERACQPAVPGVADVKWRWFLRGLKLCARPELPGLQRQRHGSNTVRQRCRGCAVPRLAPRCSSLLLLAARRCLWLGVAPPGT